MNSQEEQQVNTPDVEKIMSSVKLLHNLKGEDIQSAKEKVWSKVSSAVNAPQEAKIRLNLWKYWSVAATIALLIGCGWFFYEMNKIKKHTSEIHVVNSLYGEKKEIILPDGTRVWLNAGTQLVYPANFMGMSREVFVSGEAYFDVVKNKDHPFIVKSEVVEIKVLGTKFNVKSYSDEATVEIVLESGSVSFNKINNDQKQYILLAPDQRAEISKNSGKVMIEDIDVKFYTSWKDGKLMFKAKTFEEIVSVLEKIYNVNIEIRGEKLKQEIFTGKFTQGESIGDIFDLIKLNTPITYTYENEMYIVSEK